ncbi:MAG: peptidylprolyl isomerase [Azoarcus sp.]|nr:peptidylprolyl isomerase [Azoarcus sp.]
MKPVSTLLSALLATGLFTLAGCAGDHVANSDAAAKPDETANSIATVNGVAIPNSYADTMIESYRAQGAPDDDKLKDSVRKDLIRREVLEQAAVKAGVNKRSDIVARQNLARQNVLIQDYLQDWVKSNPPTDEEMKTEYDTVKARLEANKEYHVRHILLKTEDEAKAVIARLNKGAKFADLAKKSLDQGSKDRGGDLGWTDNTQFVPPFAEATTKLAKGKYTTTPVKTEFGYHVILLEDSRTLQVPAYEEVKAQLQQNLQNKKVQTYIEQLEQSAEVK